jgi:hypothetical protein
MLRRWRSCKKKHLRQILSKAVPKLSSIKLWHSDMSQDKGVHRLKDEMTNQPVIACIMIVSICKGHECNFSQAIWYSLARNTWILAFCQTEGINVIKYFILIFKFVWWNIWMILRACLYYLSCFMFHIFCLSLYYNFWSWRYVLHDLRPKIVIS